MIRYIFVLVTALLLNPSSTTALTISLPETTPKLLEKWQRFNNKTARGLDHFISDHLTPVTKEIKTVFYPFGGPDLTYPLMMFPSASHFVIVGLEFPGKVENVEQITATDCLPQVESLLKRSFFITSQMCKQLPKRTGVMAPLFLQLKLFGVQEVTLADPDLPYQGVKIAFHHQGQEKTIHYYRMDLSDEHNPQQFLEDLKNHQLIQGCLIKSSSYIPHQRNFKIIRDFITANARLIVQDDSGVPIKYLKKNFDIQVYGHYRGPYGAEFANYRQNDLPSGDKKLPFCFGYGCGRQYSFVMVAQKTRQQEESSLKDDNISKN
jgi:hypothetical protein